MMNDTERDALRRRILERLGWRQIPDSGSWCPPNLPPLANALGHVAPDHTRDAAAALRNLAPLLAMLVNCRNPLLDAMNHATEGWIAGIGIYADINNFDEAVALALCLAVDALPE